MPAVALEKENLAAVPGGADACRTMDADTDVALVVRVRLCRVKPHPHAEPRLGEGPLRSGGGGRGVACALEDDEEAVARRVDLDPAVSGARPADGAPVVAAKPGELGTELAHELRRALDVGEQEGDGAGRKVGPRRLHAAIVPKPPARRNDARRSGAGDDETQSLEALKVAVEGDDLGPVLERERREVRVGHEIRGRPGGPEQAPEQAEVALARMDDDRRRLVEPELHDAGRIGE
jgi:hypothetical protein